MLAGATVTVAELGLFAQTNDRGRFEFDAVPSGRYTLAFFDSPLDSLGIASPRVAVGVPAAGMIGVRLATPAPMSLLRSLCGGGVDTSSGAVVGIVRAAEDGLPISGEPVASRWSQYAISRDRGVKAHALVSTARSNATGGYVPCGLPRDIPVDLTGFDIRKRSGTGDYMTASDIERYGFVRVSEALYRFSSLFVGDSNSETDVSSNLAFRQRSLAGEYCTPRYYVDGFLESDAIDNPVTEVDRRLRPAGLRGIEVHTAFNAPVQFPPDPMSGCGVVLIWTKSP